MSYFGRAFVQISRQLTTTQCLKQSIVPTFNSLSITSTTCSLPFTTTTNQFSTVNNNNNAKNIQYNNTITINNNNNNNIFYNSNINQNLFIQKKQFASKSVEGVKELRRRTGAGILHCKKALEEANGDIEAAIKSLNEQALSTLQRDGKISAEGAVRAEASGKVGVLTQLTCQTDFVGKNEKFVNTIQSITDSISQQHDTISSIVTDSASKVDFEHIEQVATEYEGKSTTINDAISQLRFAFGENIDLKRVDAICLRNDNSAIGKYNHDGKYASLVAVEAESTAIEPAKLTDIANKLAVHVVAASPSSIAPVNNAEENSNPTDLLSQPFALEEELTVKDWLDKQSKEVNSPVKVSSFLRYAKSE